MNKNIFSGSLIIGTLITLSIFSVSWSAFPDNIFIWISFVPFYLIVLGVVGLGLEYKLHQRRGFFFLVYLPVLLAILYYMFVYIHVYVWGGQLFVGDAIVGCSAEGEGIEPCHRRFEEYLNIFKRSLKNLQLPVRVFVKMLNLTS